MYYYIHSNLTLNLCIYIYFLWHGTFTHRKSTIKYKWYFYLMVLFVGGTSVRRVSGGSTEPWRHLEMFLLVVCYDGESIPSTRQVFRHHHLQLIVIIHIRFRNNISIIVISME